MLIWNHKNANTQMQTNRQVKGIQETKSIIFIIF